MGSLIHVEDLTKHYHRPRRQEGFLGGVRTLFTRQVDTVRAVDGVSFAVEAGEVVGFLGSNGAGKSTTIKMMTGILVPTNGTLTVGGAVPWRDRERNAMQIGVVFGQRSQLWWDLPLIDSFRLIGKLYRMAPSTYRRNLDRFVDMLDMASFLDRPVRQLSLGQRMRGDLVAAMLYEPPLLYLDEPTIGLDAVAKDRMRTFIHESNRDLGTTVVLTTHDLVDVERLCRRVIFIDNGRVIYDDDVEGLKAKYAPFRILVVQVEHDRSTGMIPSVELRPGEPGEVLSQEGPVVRIRFESSHTSAPEVISAVSARYRIKDLRIEEPDLESVVRELYLGIGDGR